MPPKVLLHAKLKGSVLIELIIFRCHRKEKRILTPLFQLGKIKEDNCDTVHYVVLPPPASTSPNNNKMVKGLSPSVLRDQTNEHQ